MILDVKTETSYSIPDYEMITTPKLFSGGLNWESIARHRTAYRLQEEGHIITTVTNHWDMIKQETVVTLIGHRQELWT